MTELLDIGKQILAEVLCLEGPSVRKPGYNETLDGCVIHAGNAVLHLYDFRQGDSSRENWYGDKSASEYLGKGEGHYITSNVHRNDFGWYLSVKN